MRPTCGLHAIKQGATGLPVTDFPKFPAPRMPLKQPMAHVTSLRRANEVFRNRAPGDAADKRGWRVSSSIG